MNTNEKGSNSPQSETQHKDNAFSLKSKVLSALKHERLTAIMLNRRYGYNDARKTISELRYDGHRISDYRPPDGRKVYYCVPDTQLSLFEKGGVL